MLANDEAIRAALRDRGLFVPALVLIAIAAAAKSAQVPLHFWLPNAMVAPTPVSAFLHSATMVKVGVYFVGRLRPLLSGPEWTLLFATLGLVTMTVGALPAVASTDTKELLAYSTASHLGLMVAGFGFGSAAGGGRRLPPAQPRAVQGAAVSRRRHPRPRGRFARSTISVDSGVNSPHCYHRRPRRPQHGRDPAVQRLYSKELLFEAAYEFAHEAGGLAWLYPTTATVASIFTVVYSLSSSSPPSSASAARPRRPSRGRPSRSWSRPLSSRSAWRSSASTRS